MRAKWIVALFLAVALLCSCLTGLAETRSTQIDAYRIESISGADRLVITRHNEDGDLVDYLAAADGTILSDGYGFVRSAYDSSGSPLYSVEALKPEDDIHREGLIDNDGSVVVPLEYIRTECIGNRWAAGFKVVRATGEEYDYYNMFGSDRYVVDAVDIYYRGQLVGTLGREDYSYAYAYGDYLRLQDRNGKYTFYNKELEKSPIKRAGSDEYEYDYDADNNRVYYHQGSGVQAFCEGCPLTEEEVYWCYLNEDNKVLDLQGNVVYEVPEDKTIGDLYPSRYAVMGELAQSDKYGVVDVLTGEIIIPMEYDWNMDYYEDEGYAAVKKDEMFGYVRKGGEVTCDFVYPYKDVEKEGLLSTVKDPEGGVIVLSAVAGILPEKYKSAYINGNKARAFRAENDAGQKAIIGLNGKELVPFGDYDEINVNYDATVAVTRDMEGAFFVWTMDYADAVE